MKRELKVLIVILATTSTFLGCGTQTKLSEAHKPRPAIESNPAIQRLVVPKAKESRPLGGRSKIGNAGLLFIPLWPYVSQKITPERFLLGNYDFLQDLSVAVAMDLQTAGVAQVVTADQTVSTSAGPDTYILKLILDEGIWHRDLTWYGLSFPGALLCLILPCSFGSAELALTAELLNPTGASLGSESFRAEESVIEWSLPARFLPNLTKAFGDMTPGLRAFVAEAINKGRAK